MLAQTTTVRPLTTIRRTRVLPAFGTIHVRVGKHVSPVQIIGSCPGPDSYQILPASIALSVDKEDVEKHLIVDIGQEVKKGQPLLSKKNLLGRNRFFRSPHDGRVLGLAHGCLVLQKADSTIDVRAMLQGRVARIIVGRGVILEAEGSLIQGVWDSGVDAIGRLVVACDSPAEEIELQRVSSQLSGSIVVGGMVVDPGIINHLEEMGVRGIVAGSMPARLCHIAKELGCPVVLTDGFGRHPMSKPVFDLLVQSQGRETSLLVSTGGEFPQRSEIVIPLPTTLVQDRDDKLSYEVNVGGRTRVVNLRGRPKMGKILNVLERPNVTNGPSKLPGANVKIEDGKVSFVPMTNIDLIV